MCGLTQNIKKEVIVIACFRPLQAIRLQDGQVYVQGRADGILQNLHPVLCEETGEGFEPFTIPCGSCIGCRLDYARRWSTRCLLEQQSWVENYFLTLTYNDDELPAPIGNSLMPSLYPKHLTDFLKRLRIYYQRELDHEPIRFYACGEYGDTTWRPHYHLLAFNLPLFDLKPYSKSPLGDIYYTSDFLTEKWSHGYVVVGEITEQSASYVARYCQKKAQKNIDYKALELEKEFVRMSRRPGIGIPYFNDHYGEIYKDDKIYLPNGKISTPPRLFDQKAEELGVDMESVKGDRRFRASLVDTYKREMVSKDYNTYMNELEESFKQRTNALKRNL